MPAKSRRRTAATSGSGGKFPANAFENFNPATAKWSPENALALAWASNLAYEEDSTIKSVADQWSLQAQPAITGPLDIQGFVAGNKAIMIIAFRGTINEKNGKFDANNWLVNLDARQIDVAPAFHTTGRVHEGFARAFSTLWPGIQEDMANIQNQVQSKAQSLWITGHSLGGVLALMAAAACAFSDNRIPFNGLYTFGQPRLGNPDFCGNCDIQFGQQYFRFVNDQDIVTRVPPRFFPHFPRPDIYGHCGQLRYFDAQGHLHADEHYWNSFLANVEVGFQGLIDLPKLPPIKDHEIKSGYLTHIAAYI
jgi:triacylglycerol lipase